MSTTDLEDARDVDSPLSLLPFQSLAVHSEDETDSGVAAAEPRNDLDIDPAELQVCASPFVISNNADNLPIQRLQGLEVASQQSNDQDARIAAIKELQELATANAPLSPFDFCVLEVLAKFLAVERIPKKSSSGDVYETLVFSVVSALWSYELAKSKNPDVSMHLYLCARI
jgi:hypothetical protein